MTSDTVVNVFYHLTLSGGNSAIPVLLLIHPALQEAARNLQMNQTWALTPDILPGRGNR